jgi:hypothetical protein
MIHPLPLSVDAPKFMSDQIHIPLIKQASDAGSINWCYAPRFNHILDSVPSNAKLFGYSRYGPHPTIGLDWFSHLAAPDQVRPRVRFRVPEITQGR